MEIPRELRVQLQRRAARPARGIPNDMSTAADAAQWRAETVASTTNRWARAVLQLWFNRTRTQAGDERLKRGLKKLNLPVFADQTRIGVPSNFVWIDHLNS